MNIDSVPGCFTWPGCSSLSTLSNCPYCIGEFLKIAHKEGGYLLIKL